MAKRPRLCVYVDAQSFILYLLFCCRSVGILSMCMRQKTAVYYFIGPLLNRNPSMQCYTSMRSCVCESFLCTSQFIAERSAPHSHDSVVVAAAVIGTVGASGTTVFGSFIDGLVYSYHAVWPMYPQTQCASFAYATDTHTVNVAVQSRSIKWQRISEPRNHFSCTEFHSFSRVEWPNCDCITIHAFMNEKCIQAQFKCDILNLLRKAITFFTVEKRPKWLDQSNDWNFKRYSFPTQIILFIKQDTWPIHGPYVTCRPSS